MTRRRLASLALALLVAACAPERTEPTEAAVVSATTAHVTSPVPYMEQNYYDIVDETGASIWQPYADAAPTEASFTLAINEASCQVTPYEWFDPASGDILPAEGVSCGGSGVPSLGSSLHPSLGASDLAGCTAKRAPYPFAMINSDVTCLGLFSAGNGSLGEWPIDLEAAPTAPGNRIFKRWEVLGGDRTLLPCSQGQSSRSCRVFTRGILDQEGDGTLLIFIRLHYGLPGYDFSGFLRPVDNLPTVNTMRAGRAVPIKFSLGGDQGLNVLAPGSPSSRRVDCSSAAPLDAIEETLTAGASSLSYDAASDTYTYVWKTERTWAGTCRDLTLTLADGSAPKTVRFKF